MITRFRFYSDFTPGLSKFYEKFGFLGGRYARSVCVCAADLMKTGRPAFCPHSASHAFMAPRKPYMARKLETRAFQPCIALKISTYFMLGYRFLKLCQN